MHRYDRPDERTRRPHRPDANDGTRPDRSEAEARARFVDAGSPAADLTPEAVTFLQRAAGNAGLAAFLDPSAAPEDVLARSGRPLDSDLRADMEASFTADLSSVRIHDDAAAGRSARALGARAYTVGEDVVVGEHGADRHTIAHELAHVLQQRGGPVDGTPTAAGYRVSDPADRFELAADAAADRVAAGRSAGTDPAAARVDGMDGAGVVQRQHDQEGAPRGGPTIAPTIAQGSSGPPVRWLQLVLQALFRTVAVDGVFGPQTAAYTCLFQLLFGLPVDAVVGPRTWLMIWALAMTARQSGTGGSAAAPSAAAGGQAPGAAAAVGGAAASQGATVQRQAAAGTDTNSAEPTAEPRPTLRVGDSGPEVRQLQTMLATVWPDVAVDGTFGFETQAYVLLWQVELRLAADGVVGPATWATLDAILSPSLAESTAGPAKSPAAPGGPKS